jgi:hypothetical protein
MYRIEVVRSFGPSVALRVEADRLIQRQVFEAHTERRGPTRDDQAQAFLIVPMHLHPQRTAPPRSATLAQAVASFRAVGQIGISHHELGALVR